MGVILVVDDHPMNCEPLVRLFRFAGHDAWCEVCGPDAVAALAVRLPHVVLLDVMMPGMDGFEVLRVVRAERRYDPVVVLMYTAMLDDDLRERAARSGAQGYIVKGTAFADVHDQVRRHLPRP